MNTYLITGVAGFIGSNLANVILSNGDKVVGMDNFSNGKQTNIDAISAHPNAQNFTFFEGDIRNTDDCKKACNNVDFVLHQAALGSVPRSVKEPRLYHENNITGTLNMLQAAVDANVKRFVFASSSSAYGDTPTLPKVETIIPTPKSPYAVSKLTGEYYCKIFFDCYGLETISLRYFNIFGPRQDPNSQYAAVIPKFVTSFLANTPPTIFGDGEQTRDFTFVANVVQANIKACTAGSEAFGKALNIGCEDRISLNRLANTIKSITGSTVDPNYGPPRAGDVRDSLADIELAKKHLGLSNIIPLSEGLQQTIDWYKTN